MLEGKGNFVFNYATGPLGHLDLANLEWVVDDGRPACASPTISRVKELSPRQRTRPQLSGTSCLRRQRDVADRTHRPSWRRRPDQRTDAGDLDQTRRPDGQEYSRRQRRCHRLRARRFILGLHGQQAPYQLAARINVNDIIATDTKLEADRWAHIAMTAEPFDGQWRVRLFHNGQPVGEGLTNMFPSDSPIVPSLILGRGTVLLPRRLLPRPHRPHTGL